MSARNRVAVRVASRPVEHYSQVAFADLVGVRVRVRVRVRAKVRVRVRVSSQW